MKYAIRAGWLANPSQGCSQFPRNSHEFLIHYQSEDSCAHQMLIHILPIMLTIELRIVTIFWARYSISSKHVSFWDMILEPHQDTYHSNIGLWFRQLIELRMSTLHTSTIWEFQGLLLVFSYMMHGLKSFVAYGCIPMNLEIGF
jgi:hypothetical protein